MRTFALPLLPAALAALFVLACSDPDESGPPCGNGVVDPGEECDDGNAIGSDDCTPLCKLAVCGDGVVRTDPADPQGLEECDTLGVDSDSCDADCTLVRCGDGPHNVVAGERCDDGNTVSADGCRADCLSDEACGNGLVDNHLPRTRATDPGTCLHATAQGTGCAEVCDDGNTVSGDGCSANCLSEETCRNGILDPNGNGGSNPSEACDDGNSVDTDACRNDCQGGAGCGNGLLDVGAGEQCDAGPQETATCDWSADPNDAQRCTLPVCGDGHRNVLAGEACDDGNQVVTDNCVGCAEARCGDGALDLAAPGIEECDDANASSNDNCTTACRYNVCGDGFRDLAPPVTEACDLGAQNGVPGSGCSATCTIP